MSQSMTSADHFWYCMDDPTNLMIITAFMEFEELIDFERLCATIEHRLASFPRFQKRVITPASGVGAPGWETDSHFDVRSHVQRIALPPPGDKVALQEMVSGLMTTPLDPNKPLWHVYLIEKFGKGCVLFFRIHHCIADGIALVHVLLSAADKKPDAPWPTGSPKKKRADISLPDLLLPFRSVIKSVRHAADATQKAGKKVIDELKEVISKPDYLLELAKSGSELATDVVSVLTKLLIMPSDPKTAFKGKLGVRKTAVWTDPMMLDKIKTVGRAINTTTLNDVLIATVTGAMRRYLKSRNYPVNKLDLRVTVPVNIRKPGTEFELGNRFSLVFLALPVYLEDPILRLKEVKRRMDHLKKAPDAAMNFGLLSAMGLFPPGLAKNMAHLFGNKASAVLTNVPGPREPLYFAGRKINNIMFWVPRSGSVGLGISILSYDGKVTVGLAADEGLMPDPEVLLEGFEDEFNYLLDLVNSGKIFDEPLVLHDRYQEARCKALTKSGEQCKKRAMAGLGYCNVHKAGAEKGVQAHIGKDLRSEDEKETDAIPGKAPGRCKGTTKSGRQCSKQAAHGSGYCSIHRPKMPEKDSRAKDLAEILRELKKL
ncbi:MAG: wax ester/triacylglycerol synthase family O-acyltransferase [Desulfobacteraceae bacterium]|uniref:diacylglycerol O-acyltransferase n=1 Tax=Candidatus Desulfacyla euxinica TaxID=2841693 RepID=A0A8J6N0G0_9DELT|nr:wax ester/triacylglycerol synthase family O-acyltransferase [Candidatus Desulfacyla euxinica]MBL6978604.1 wax ester/triacylglycerol synthase family O-acyltransferase [Desulfobacteraceae bacterium]MBL7217212.1 wax ester/triacylglycerol synthase family O-acyltransferase [Desulfobacteraceae bacterium]